MLGNVINWAFNLILNRQLTLDEFSTVSFFVSVMVITSSFTISIQYLGMKYAAAYKKSKPKLIQFLNQSISFVLSWGVLTGLLFFFTNHLWQPSFNLNLSELTIFILSTMFVVLNLLGWVRGVIAGLNALTLLGLVVLTEGIIKISTVIAGLFTDSLFTYSLLSLPLSLALASAFGLYILHKKQALPTKISAQLNMDSKYSGFVLHTLVLVFGLGIFLSLDVVLTRYYFDPNTAGLYATLSLVGKIIFFIVTSMIGVLTPSIARRQANKKSIRGLLIWSVTGAGIIGATISYVFSTWPYQLLPFLINPAHIPAIADSLLLFCLSATALGMVTISTTYTMFIKKTTQIFVLALAVSIQVIGISLFHQSISQVVNVMAVTASTALIITALNLAQKQLNFLRA